MFMAAAWPAAAQSWDASGNGMLNGTYNFRHVMWLGGYNSSNNLQEAIAVYGNIVFDGKGDYTLVAKAADAAKNTVQPISGSGTYTIAASGYGYMSTPFQFVNSQFKGDEINLLVSPSQVLAGSTSDNNSGYNDLFLAAPVPASAPSFQGTFSVIGVDVLTLTMDLAHTRAYSFTLTGNDTTVTTTALTGALGLNTTSMTQAAFDGVKYSTGSGVASITFGSELTTANLDSNLMSGSKSFYFSPDGNFFFGGSPGDTDFIVGVRQASSGSFAAKTLYYTAGFFQDSSEFSTCNCAWLNSTYGAYGGLADGSNVGILAHQRDNVVGPPRGSFLADSTYYELPTASSGASSDFYYNYFFGPGGKFAIGLSNNNAGFMGIDVLLEGPHYSSAPTSSPYIYPTGIVNAAASVPFTAEFAPGEFVSIFGANLATATAAGPTFPIGLDGVQVLVNGEPAAVNYVSPGQINAVIPLDIETSVASIQVVNSLGTSNMVSNYIGKSQPGIFNSTTAASAVFHGNGTIVSVSNPAAVGEELAIYLTGLGTVASTGNTNVLPDVDFSGNLATVDYAGIEPGTPLALGAGYQLNVTVPVGTSPGLNYLDITGLYSSNLEALVCVTSCGDASLRPAVGSLAVASLKTKTNRSAVQTRFPGSPTVVFPGRP